MKQSLINIVANTFFIAFVLFAVVLLFIPKGLFQKFNIDPVSRKIIDKGGCIFYRDLDNDGTSEIIRRYIDRAGMNAMNVYLYDGTIVDQFNFGRKTEIHHLLFDSDRDKNGLKEVYDLSYSNDSIFLNWVEPLNKSDNITHSVFVTTMEYNHYGNIDFPGRNFMIADLNNDGYNEIVFAVNGGYSKFPRKVFAYDFINDTLFSSPFTGAKIFITEIKDINNDGYVEIILRTTANANISLNDSILDDEHSYLMVLDHNLNFLFKPVPFFGYPSSLSTLSEKVNDRWVLIGFFSLAGKNGESQKFVMYDNKGNEIKHIDVPGRNYRMFRSKTDSSTFILFGGDNRNVRFFDNKLNEKQSFPIIRNSNRGQADLNDDGKFEWIGYGDDQQTVFVYTHDFTYSTTIKIPVPGHYDYCFKFSKVKSKEKGLFHVQKDEYNFIYKYYKNKYYYLKFPFYFGIYLFLLLIVFIIQKLQRYQMERKLALEKQISELQLKTIRSQMDPHFTFNALNSINSIIYKGDKEKAQRYFTKFSKLVRSTLESSDRITRTLNDEIEFVEDYLSLEKVRFREKLDYIINVSGNVNKSQLIPKMIIQIYAENAIKHGLKNKMTGGLLKIDISQNKNILKIIIEDNGIGRRKAAELGIHSTGYGMKIMETIGKLYFKLYKSEIRQTIKDLYDKNGKAAGTRVTIEIEQKTGQA